MVFGGLIKHFGLPTLDGHRMKVEVDFDVKDINLGDSIAINGVCLTVINIEENILYFNVSEETLECTTLKSLTWKQMVNVDFPLKYSSLLDGHILSGHVHETGIVTHIITCLDSHEIWIKVKNYHNLKFKDSIAVDGISLTIAEIENDSFRVSIIPHTFKNTQLDILKINDRVNIEYNMKEIINSDEYFMKRVVKLSEKGRNTAPPNPWVGCIIVKNGEILGEGYHVKAGENHAEVNAFQNIAETDTDVYVTLEPCSHFGRTPPCVDLLIEKKVKKVIIGLIDPDNRVNGSGIQKLKNHGIEVLTGVCEDLIKKSLRSYLYHRRNKLPFVSLKIACSMDGGIQDYMGNSRWITGEDSRNHSHQLRAEHMAIMVGTNTIINDNPSLTARHTKVVQPLRIVLDRRGRIKWNEKLNIFNYQASTIIFTSLTGEEYRNKTLNLKTDIYQISEYNNQLDLEDILYKLNELNIISVLVEGGPLLHTSFLQSNLVQEIYVYRSGHILGPNSYHWSDHINNRRLDEDKLVSILDTKILGEDILEHYKVINNFKQKDMSFSDIQIALNAFKEGEMIIVVDNESRENEGDLIVAGEFITESQMTFIINNTTGIICTPMTKQLANKLELSPMVINNTDNHQTAFTVSCDSVHSHTGVSAHDRVLTVKALLEETPSGLRRPGHMFPLIARDGLLSERQGHTEAALSLCDICNLNKIAVISELKNNDGSMKNRQQCLTFGIENNIPIISTSQIIKYQNINVIPSTYLSECDFVNDYGEWILRCYPSRTEKPHIVLIKGKIDDNIPIRIHSECFTGDILGSYLCDCGFQLKNAMKYMQKYGKGIIIYVNGHEGRGIGLTDKIKAYKLQQKENITTYEANIQLGHPEDSRDYTEIIEILNSLNVQNIHLLTNNPSKIKCLSENFNVTYEPILGQETSENIKYLKDKQEYFAAQNGNYQKKVLNKLTVLPNRHDIKNYKICIVSTMWHQELIDRMKNETINELKSLGIEDISEYNVPGCFEIPWICNKISKQYDCVICIGILIKGETAHFEHVSSAAVNGIMNVQIKFGTPIVDGILCCLNLEQVLERVKPESGLAKSYALTAIKMCDLNKDEN